MRKLCLLLVFLFLFGCGSLAHNNADPRPDLALPDLWEEQPASFYFAPLAIEDHPDSDVVRETERSIRYLKNHYLPYLGMYEDEENPEITFHTILFEDNDDINFGRTYHLTKACRIELNEDRIKEVPVLWDRALKNTYVHEAGHCLGLVVTPTESAQRSPGDTLNHCRHFDCAMTIRGIGSDLDQFLGWLENVGSDEPTFCRHCEEYLMKRLEERHNEQENASVAH